MSQFEDITYAAQGGIANIVINRPQVRNAVRPQTYEELTRAISIAADDPEVGVVVLSGAGDKAFCAGGDVGDQSKRYPEVGRTHMRRLIALSTAMRMIDKPIIAKVRGYCVGGGVGLALACDLRICTEGSKFAVPAAKLSLGYRYSGLKKLVDVVGPSFAKEIFYTARQFTAQEAQGMGLVNRVVPDAELESYVQNYAETIAGNAPLTVDSVKFIVGEILKDPADRDMDKAEAMVQACFASADYIEGRKAFMEKRKPKFTGK